MHEGLKSAMSDELLTSHATYLFALRMRRMGSRIYV